MASSAGLSQSATWPREEGTVPRALSDGGAGVEALNQASFSSCPGTGTLAQRPRAQPNQSEANHRIMNTSQHRTMKGNPNHCNPARTARRPHPHRTASIRTGLAALAALAAVNASAVTETFDGYADGTALTAVGGGGEWTFGGSVVNPGGVNGTAGLDIASPIFNWKGQPFQWSTLAIGTKVAMSLDFQTSTAGKFDDDRVGWTVNADASTSSANQFALQLDNTSDGGMVCYWDSNRTVLNALSGIQASTWYRFNVEYTKLTATSAGIVGTLTELDGSGNPTGTPWVGTIADTSAAPYSAPTSRFTSTSQWPSYKNYNATAGNADNASFTITDTPPTRGASMSSSSASMVSGGRT